jgi:ubiquitin C-terminal hydrolase
MGIVGLQNLGNTCFMNTSLQCISNCWELINYFLRNCYKTDLNEKNPIGTGGVLARAYANLVKNIWYGGKGVYSPWNFKRALATFQPMFSGYQQHDTQEFLNYLLDGLHEDLNRVINKPIVDKDESKKPDNIKALEEWYAFQLRNQSVLVDLLYGQYKSTLYCPNEKCQNISTTFDTFLSISLPLTNKVEPYEVICFFIFYDVSISPIQLLLPFSSECTLMALRNKIGKILDVHPFSFFIVKMDGTGNYDYLVSSTGLLKTNNYYQNANQKPFFLFQINPDLFYNNPENKYFNPNLRNTLEKSNGLASSQILNPISTNLYKNRDFRDTFSNLELNVEETKKLFKEDYEEDESNTTSETTDCFYSNVNILNSNKETILGIMKVNTDDNHGFCSEYIRLVVHLTYHNVNEKNTNISDTFSRDRVIFPRIMYVKTEWTLAELYYLLFQYFFPIINKKNESVEIMWKRIFGVLDTNYSNDTYEFHKKCNYPYRVRVKNVMRERNKPCIMCNELDCRNCLLPFTNEIKIKDIINKYPRSDIGAKIDNTYLYLQDFQRKYHQKWNRDFSLELSWLTEYKSDVHRLNEKVDHDFKIQKSDILSGISIYDCFKKFIKLEKLEDMNEWYCSNCKTHQKATKKMEIYKSPHILIIHLKRFKNMEKLDCLVDFPLVDLDLKQYVISNEEGLPLTYDLFAVANHVGNSGFGHYFSYAKNPINEKWYKFDDASVTNLPQKEIVTPSAYVLFYRRRNLENYIDLEDIYQRKFINYVSLMKSVEENIGTINKYIINPDD